MTHYDPLADLIERLEELESKEREATRLALFAAQQVDRAEGCDDTGNVAVTIDADNHIIDSTVKAQWAREIDPDKLSKAYSEADEAALQQRDALLAHLIDKAEKTGEIGVLARDPRPEIERAAQASGAPTRSASQLRKDYLAWQKAPEGVSASGDNEEGTVTVVVTERGFDHCGIAREWAMTEESWKIAAGMVQASGDAREKLDKKVRRPSVSALDLAADALRIFRQNAQR